MMESNKVQEEFTLESFPDLNREEVYKKVVKYLLIENYNGRQYIDNQTEIISIENKIKEGTFNIEEEIIKSKARMGEEMYKLCCGLNTSQETLDLLFDALNEAREKVADFHSYGSYINTIALNPNTDPKTIEKNIENLLYFAFNPSFSDGKKTGIFLSRPDLTPETISKIAKSILPTHDYITLSKIATLIYNPNTPPDLREEFLQSKDMKRMLQEDKRLGLTKEHYLNLDEENFKAIDRIYPEKK